MAHSTQPARRTESDKMLVTGQGAGQDGCCFSNRPTYFTQRFHGSVGDAQVRHVGRRRFTVAKAFVIPGILQPTDATTGQFPKSVVSDRAKVRPARSHFPDEGNLPRARAAKVAHHLIHFEQSLPAGPEPEPHSDAEPMPMRTAPPPGHGVPILAPRTASAAAPACASSKARAGILRCREPASGKVHCLISPPPTRSPHMEPRHQGEEECFHCRVSIAFHWIVCAIPSRLVADHPDDVVLSHALEHGQRKSVNPEIPAQR